MVNRNSAILCNSGLKYESWIFKNSNLYFCTAEKKIQVPGDSHSDSNEGDSFCDILSQNRNRLQSTGIS